VRQLALEVLELQDRVMMVVATTLLPNTEVVEEVEKVLLVQPLLIPTVVLVVRELQIIIEMVMKMEQLLGFIILREVVEEVVILAPVERLLMAEERAELILQMGRQQLPIVVAEVEQVLLGRRQEQMEVRES
jgi:hypothetical protein